ncbi:E3 ubiquitin-protein ligase RNF8 [Orussus abietinus]|uniref:E3 ubiquitin-protein ligase RNF8 n=1 Tax=Orussus abietinus TaxID=222816 RepID=UPI000625D53F|nr:E3 ubiquitin-protein ligase RNF8 [Orussus abietinus]XP_012286357.1 E3 ubiquitin-protein ligase RNF8 [Orussus abietinus]XP_012286358.1 E3 ubiquitin-protein ligase RNF8 [Orussus abietinus]
MGRLRAKKRKMTQDYHPILVNLEPVDQGTRDIVLCKNEFKIGRGLNNDEVISNLSISRSQCVLRRDDKGNWTITDLSSCCTFLNGEPLGRGVTREIRIGDTVQFSPMVEYKYVFTVDAKEVNRELKKRRADKQVFNHILLEQKTFLETNQVQRKELENKLEAEQKKQQELKLKLKELLESQDVGSDDNHQRIDTLKRNIEAGNIAESLLRKSYYELLEKLKDERLKFEARLNDEKQKWQEALDSSKQEQAALETNMKKQMESWRAEQEVEWKKVMENSIKEEKTIQSKLLDEKLLLEQKLKEMEEALRESEAKASMLLTQNDTDDSKASLDDLGVVIVDMVGTDSQKDLQILGTIDLTVDSPSPSSSEIGAGEKVFDKVGDIMDEQLTCSICSELFIRAMTLNCTHTFCQYCISSWMKKRKECPVCRCTVTSSTRSLVLDNFIEGMLNNMPSRYKIRRDEVLDERRAKEEQGARSSVR